MFEQLVASVAGRSVVQAHRWSDEGIRGGVGQLGA